MFDDRAAAARQAQMDRAAERARQILAARLRIAAAWALLLIVVCGAALVGLIVAAVYVAGARHG
jgi:hypothetical protein